MNYLMLSVGRRGELMKDFRASMEEGSRIIATDNSPYAPALYFADKRYIVPRIDAPEYIDTIVGICNKEQINAITTFIDPEIMLLAENRERFAEIGVEVLAPYTETAKLCFDKYEMFKYLREKGIQTAMTWGTFEEVKAALDAGEVSLPVFVKPRTGSGSVGARKVHSLSELKDAFKLDSSLIAQELMTGEGCFDLDADVYVDTISHKPVAIFSKRNISTEQTSIMIKRTKREERSSNRLALITLSLLCREVRCRFALISQKTLRIRRSSRRQKGI